MGGTEGLLSSEGKKVIFDLFTFEVPHFWSHSFLFEFHLTLVTTTSTDWYSPLCLLFSFKINQQVQGKGDVDAFGPFNNQQFQEPFQISYRRTSISFQSLRSSRSCQQWMQHRWHLPAKKAISGRWCDCVE